MPVKHRCVLAFFLTSHFIHSLAWHKRQPVFSISVLVSDSGKYTPIHTLTHFNPDRVKPIVLDTESMSPPWMTGHEGPESLCPAGMTHQIPHHGAGETNACFDWTEWGSWLLLFCGKSFFHRRNKCCSYNTSS